MTAMTMTAHRRLKRVIVTVTTLCCTALVLLGIKLVDVAVNDWMGITAHDTDNMSEASRWFNRNHRLNHIDPWLVHYNSGTAAFGEQRWEDAAGHYRTALPLAPTAHRCRVALNLAWTLEARGDSLKTAGNNTEAQQSWTEAQQVLAQNHCSTPKPEQQKKRPKPDPEQQAANPRPPTGDQSEQQQHTGQRIGNKQQEASPDPRQHTRQPSDRQAREQRARQLEQKRRKAAERASRARDKAPQRKAADPQDKATTTERPW